MSSVASFVFTSVIILSQIEMISTMISENATLLKAVGSLFLFAFAYVSFYITLGKFCSEGEKTKVFRIDGSPLMMFLFSLQTSEYY